LILEAVMTARTTERTGTAARVQKHRAALREAGLRPVQIWVPDTRRTGFAKECRRQSLLLRDDAHEREIADWLEEAADREGWQ
jgi:Antitoxin MazE-like